MPERVAVTGPTQERYVEVLSAKALELVALLHDALADRRAQALARRRRRQAEISIGQSFDFLPETAEIRADPSWRVGGPAPGLVDRRVEITGPPGRTTTVSALNSGANVWLADFEDTSTPLWANLIEGQLNLKDALDRTIDFVAADPGPGDPGPGDGTAYALEPDDKLATIVVRPRGWHLDEKHILVDGQRTSGGLVDFALYLTACAQRQLDKGKGPYFYLPKLESHLEARLWNDAFNLAQDYLGLPRGTIRATAAIETVPAAFEMEEILYELREHCAGLHAGRWDYLFSVIKKFRLRGREFVLPERSAITMTAPFLRAYTELLVQTCHKRGAFALGGTAAFIPSPGDAALNEAALAKVREDKAREAGDGFDGSLVAHPDLVPVCREVFGSVLGDAPNQLGRQRPEVSVTAEDLLAIGKTPGGITEAGLRANISVALQYLASWLGGNGAVAIGSSHLMENTATAEICRSQVWQWIHTETLLDDGPLVTRDVVERMIDEELAKIHELTGDSFNTARYGQAVALFTDVALADSFVEFLTLPAYERMP